MGLAECQLVSWLAFSDRVQPGDSITLPDKIPSSFEDYFARCRNLVRGGSSQPRSWENERRCWTAARSIEIRQV
jgi:hypothetical protein